MLLVSKNHPVGGRTQRPARSFGSLYGIAPNDVSLPENWHFALRFTDDGAPARKFSQKELTLVLGASYVQKRQRAFPAKTPRKDNTMDTTTQTTPAPTVATRLRRALLLAAIPAVILASRTVKSDDVTLALNNGESWTIEIAPRTPAEPVGQVALQTPAPQTPARPPAPPEPTGAQLAHYQSPGPEVVVEEVEVTETFGIEIVPEDKLRVNGLTYREVYDSIPYSRAEYLANPAYRHEATMELLTGVPRQKVVHSSYEPKLNTPLPPQQQFLYNRYGTFGGTFGPQVGYGYGFGGAFYRPQYAPAFRYFLPLDFGI